MTKNITELRKQAEEIINVLSLATPPLGIKMLADEADVPKEAKRPVKDLGAHMSLCMAYALSGRSGMVIAEFKEDMWCPEPVIGLGFEKPLQYFLEGHIRYPGSAKNLEAGGNWAKNMPHFEYGKYKGIVVGPLGLINFHPDIFMICCNPGQLLQLIMAKNWIDGLDVQTTMSGHVVCVYAVVPVLREGKIAVNCPCSGCFRIGMAAETDMIFSAPVDMLHDLVEGLLDLRKYRWGKPYNLVAINPEYPLAGKYGEVAEKLGMDWVKTGKRIYEYK